jgi:hypothetical protein
LLGGQGEGGGLVVFHIVVWHGLTSMSSVFGAL